MNAVPTDQCSLVHNDSMPSLLTDLRHYYQHRFDSDNYRDTTNYTHSLLTLKFIMRGEQQFQLDDQRLRVRPNCFLLINPGSTIRRLSQPGNDHSSIDILFPAVLLRGLLKQPSIAFPYLPGSLYEMTPLATVALHPFVQEVEMKDDEQVYKAYLGISEVLLYYQQLNASRVHTIKASRLETKEDLFARLQQAKAYILSKFETIVSIAEIAKACSLSQSLLTKHYAMVFGVSPKQDIIQLKLDYSKQLLQTTNMQVLDIVTQVGFINPSSFIRLFRSLTGMTPGNYRSSIADRKQDNYRMQTDLVYLS
ncbi:MAG TPA: AraC family transcriptional regulator [Chitinophagaceae bacterium]|nr:AraC family transcriptional regulator [Chitinophagaceae bacterium]